MASPSFQSSYVELWREPNITRPEPLRIVKERANTIAGCSTPRAVPMPRRGSAGCQDASRPSPEGPHRSLTIHKKRRARGSVLDGSFDWNPKDTIVNNDLGQRAGSNDIIVNERDRTTMARELYARTASVGSYLKTELFRGSSESDATIILPQLEKAHPRDRTDNSNPLNLDLFPPFNVTNTTPSPHMHPERLRRQQSRGKKLISKAFDRFGNARSKSMHFLRSKSSKDSLLRQISLRNLESSHPISPGSTSRSSSRFSFEQESTVMIDSSDVSIISGIESPLGITLSFILYPEIRVVPEVSSLDANDEACIWVAVMVTGVLQRTRGHSKLPDASLAAENTRIDESGMSSGNADYGYLYGVNLELTARKGCVLETVIAENSQLRRLYLGQTELILARVKMSVSKRSASHVRGSSKELIADLESQLGNLTTEYLIVGISYKHSAFPTSEDLVTTHNGLSYLATSIKIEAHATIKRHCSHSSWRNKDLDNSDKNGQTNPVISSITAHCDLMRAAELISRITSDHVPLADQMHEQELDPARRWDSSSDTIVPAKRNPPVNLHCKPAQQESSITPSTPKQSLDITQAGFHDPDYNAGRLALNPCSDLDPARRIWSEMRKNSRGAGGTVKRRVQAKSCPESFDSSTEEIGDGDASMIKEQARIMEIALRNKRSVGADTLRSMAAPSMGLSMGRGWGWGPPWW